MLAYAKKPRGIKAQRLKQERWVAMLAFWSTEIHTWSCHNWENEGSTIGAGKVKYPSEYQFGKLSQSEPLLGGREKWFDDKENNSSNKQATLRRAM